MDERSPESLERPEVGPLRRLIAILDKLTTRNGSYWVVGALVALLLVWLAPFQFAGQPEETVATIAWTWWPFQIVYAAVGFSLAVCTWRRLVREVRRATRGARIAPSPPDGAPHEGITVNQARERLEAAGLRMMGESDVGLAVARNPWAPLGGAVFHLAILLVALAFVVHLSTSEEFTFRVVEQQSFSEALAASEVDPARPGASGLDVYTLLRVEPDYYEDYLLFTRLEATMELTDGSERTASLSNPLWLDPVTLLSIQDYGFAPGFRVDSFSGQDVDAVVAMQVFPPGTEDSVDFPEAGARVVAKVYPDHGVVDGRDVSLSYRADNPRLLLTLEQPQGSPQLVDRGLVAIGESIGTDELAVTVTGLSTYGAFRVTRTWGIPLFALGAVSMVLGLSVRVFVRRLDVVVWETDEGIAYDARMDATDREEARATAGRILGRRDGS